LELFVLILCHFTEMTSLDQHVLMNMQNVERTGKKVDQTSDTVAGSLDIVAGSFNLDKSIDFCQSQKSLQNSTLSPVCVPGLIQHKLRATNLSKL